MSDFIKSSVDKLFYNDLGQKIVSGIFGLALALMFHRVCKDCTLYFAPNLKDIKNTIFKLEDTCYKYEPYIVDCIKDENKILKPYDINTTPENKIDKKKIISTINEN